MNGLSPSGFQVLPPVVKNLLIINGIMLLATYSMGISMDLDLKNTLGLHYFSSDLFEPYQLITYMFMHGDITHLFFNMFALWMFGSVIENVWGPKRFIIYYIITGIGASLLHYGINYFEIQQLLSVMDPQEVNIVMEKGADVISSGHNYVTVSMNKLNSLYNAPLVGASGSLFGILLAFGMLFPETSLYMMFIPIPIKAKYFVAGYGALELINGFQNNPNDNVAHFAHLGGMLFGFLLIKYWKYKSEI